MKASWRDDADGEGENGVTHGEASERAHHLARHVRHERRTITPTRAREQQRAAPDATAPNFHWVHAKSLTSWRLPHQLPTSRLADRAARHRSVRCSAEFTVTFPTGYGTRLPRSGSPYLSCSSSSCCICAGLSRGTRERSCSAN